MCKVVNGVDMEQKILAPGRCTTKVQYFQFTV